MATVESPPQGAAMAPPPSQHAYPKAKLKEIPLSRIRESKIALRSVNRQLPNYLELVASIRNHGVLNPIVVRELGKEDGEMVYSLVDGLQRYTASGDAGRDQIPANVIDLADAAVLEAQIIGNAVRVETKKFQYAKQLELILSQNPFMTMAQLSERLSKSPSWLNDQLGLAKLPEDVGKLVDEGKLPLANGYVMSKLPPEEIPAFIERALTQQANEFAPQVNARVKEIRDARRQGRADRGEQFVAVPLLQKIATIRGEIDNPQAIHALLIAAAPKTPTDAAKIALLWCLHLDPASVAEAERKHKERVEREKKEKEERDKDKLARKTLDAQRIAAELSGKATEKGLDLNAEKARIEAEKVAKEAPTAKAEPFEQEAAATASKR